MFSTFPGGSPGYGLLILRTALGLTAIIRGTVYLSEIVDLSFLNWITGLLTITVGIFFLVGFLTPIIGAIVFTAGISFGILSVATNQTAPIFIGINVIAIAAAIALLGPGAFSLDAYLFGRREIIIPKNPSALTD